MFDELVDSCRKPHDWPLNLLGERLLKSKLIQTQSLLHSQGKRLFIKDPKQARLFILEIYVGDEDVERTAVNHASQLEPHYRKHIRNKEKDPRMRHVFLTAKQDEAPLACTLTMFQYLCSYHQISPGFLDLICSFGPHFQNWNSNSFHHMHVLHELSDKPPYFSMIMPEIGRSGKELRVAYKLFAMEQQEPGSGGKWVMRQTATYHTLDLVEWKAFWITVKANDLIQQRVEEATTNRSEPINLSPAAQAILRSVATHQIMFDWCTDGWGWCINDISHKAEKILGPATAAFIPPEKDLLDPSPGLVRLQSCLYPPSGKEDALTNGKKLSSARPHDTTTPSSNTIGTQSDSTSTVNTTEGLSQSLQSQIGSTTERLNVLKNFSFKEVQQLGILCNNLRDAKTAMTANMRMSEEISKIYSHLLTSTISSPNQEDKDYLDAICQFQEFLRSVAHNFKSDCTRIDNILERIAEGRCLYHHILDMQKAELKTLHAVNQNVSSERMQKSSIVMEQVTKNMYAIAERTERDTTSMHLITFVTLVFLPVTLFSTIYSLSAFEDHHISIISSWDLNRDVLLLFLNICLPMMVTTLGLWMAYRMYKRKARTGTGVGEQGWIEKVF